MRLITCIRTFVESGDSSASAAPAGDSAMDRGTPGRVKERHLTRVGRKGAQNARGARSQACLQTGVWGKRAACALPTVADPLAFIVAER